jgi:hypothetical protein
MYQSQNQKFTNSMTGLAKVTIQLNYCEEKLLSCQPDSAFSMDFIVIN